MAENFIKIDKESMRIYRSQFLRLPPQITKTDKTSEAINTGIPIEYLVDYDILPVEDIYQLNVSTEIKDRIIDYFIYKGKIKSKDEVPTTKVEQVVEVAPIIEQLTEEENILKQEKEISKQAKEIARLNKEISSLYDEIEKYKQSTAGMRSTEVYIKDIDRLNKELENLYRDLEKYKTEIYDLKLTNKENDEKILQLSEEIIYLKKQIEQLKSIKTGTDSEVAYLKIYQEEIEVLNLEIEEYKGQLNHLEKDKEELNNKLNNSNGDEIDYEQLRLVTAERDNLRLQLDEIDKEITNVKSNQDGSEAELSKIQDKYSVELAELTKQVEELDSKLDEALKEKELKTDELKALKEKLEVTIEDYSKVNDELGVTRSDRIRLQTELNNSLRHADELNDELNKLYNDLGVSEDASKLIAQERELSKNSQDKLQQDIDKLKLEYTELQKEFELSNYEKEELNLEFEKLKQSYDEACELNSKSLENKGSLEVEVAELNKQIDLAKKQLEKEQEKLLKITGINEDLTLEVKELKEQIDELSTTNKKEVEKLEIKHNNLSTDVENYTSEISKLKEENVNLQNEIDGYKIELSKSQREITELKIEVSNNELDNNNLKLDIERIKGLLEVKTEEYNKKFKDVVNLENENISINSKLSISEDKNTTLEARIAKLYSEITDNTSLLEITKLNQEVNNLKTIISENDQKQFIIVQERDRLEQELQEKETSHLSTIKALNEANDAKIYEYKMMLADNTSQGITVNTSEKDDISLDITKARMEGKKIVSIIGHRLFDIYSHISEIDGIYVVEGPVDADLYLVMTDLTKNSIDKFKQNLREYRNSLKIMVNWSDNVPFDANSIAGTNIDIIIKTDPNWYKETWTNEYALPEWSNDLSYKIKQTLGVY